MIRALPRLDLSPTSRWRVFLAVLLSAARHGDQDARLSIADLAHLTGLCPRTVKTSLADLRARGLVERVGRYRRLRIHLHVPDEPKRAPPRNPGRSTPESSRTFTARQEALIVTVLAEVSALLSADARSLPFPAPARVGLRGPSTFGDVYERLRGGASAGQLSAYVRAVLGLVHDKRIQGEELGY
jgi:hypothetical protein